MTKSAGARAVEDADPYGGTRVDVGNDPYSGSSRTPTPTKDAAGHQAKGTGDAEPWDWAESLEIAAAYGIGYREWETLLPGEMRRICRARARRRNEDAYLLAALIRRAVWGKEMPSFGEIFPEEDKSEDMSDEDMFRMARALNAMLGGKEE